MNIEEQFVIGVDDTDAEDAGGTGDLVRALADHLAERAGSTSLGITEHRLWESPKVNATSSNTSYALVVTAEQSSLDMEDFVADFVRSQAQPGSNPGIALLLRHSDMPHALAFGRRAQQELLPARDLERYSTESNVLSRGLGGDRSGAIGALAAAGLRAGGKDGHFIELQGLSEVAGRMTAGAIRSSTAIQHILGQDGEELDRDDPIEGLDGIRPVVEDGEPVLHVKNKPGERRLWIPA